jgi:alpha-mannosidase
VIFAGPALAGLVPAKQAALITDQSASKRIYLAPDDHTDYFWTADAETYRQAFLDMLDYYLDLADSTASEPTEYQSRWNCDGSFWLWVYERNKPSATFERLVSRIRDGHITAPLNALVVCLGGAPAEAVLRGFYYAGRIERRYNLRFRVAVAMENQTLPYGLSALWAGAGARYSWKGICGCATKVPSAGDREHDIYWMVGPDGSRVLMKWNSFNGNQSMGGYAEARDPAAVVEFVDTDAGFAARYPYNVIGAFGKGWDDLKTLTNEFVTIAKQKTTAARQVIVSNQVDFFQDFEATYGTGLPSVACSFGNEWDLYCASMAEVSARVKRAVEKLRAAEALATLVSVRQPSFMDGRTDARDTAYMALGLYWEHNWTADGPLGRDIRAAWQRELAGQIESYADTLYTDAATELAAMIATSGTAQRFYAFNPLSWPRTDSADLPYADTAPVHVVDLSTGQETPSQIVIVDGQRKLRILASDVPAIGYKVFEIRLGAGAAFADAATVAQGGTVIENDFYRITLADRGAITGLLDKQRGNREFAQSIGGRALNDLGPGGGTLSVENAGPVSVTLRAMSSGPLAHTTRLTLTRGSRRISISNQIEQNFGDTHTWSFGFALSQPDVWHEEVGAVIRARLLADGGHYSPRNARYDWLTLNHFADISGGDVGLTLSNADCYFFQIGSSTSTSLDISTPQLNVLAGGQVDGLQLGIPNQAGDAGFVQRFALQTHDAFDPLAAMRFALEHQTPLVTANITGGSAYPAETYWFLTIANPNVLLWALKPADDGIAQAGTVARLWNMSAAAAECTLSAAPGPIASARQVTHIETPVGDLPVNDGALTVSLAAHQIKTVAFTLPDPATGCDGTCVYLPLVCEADQVSRTLSGGAR